MKFSTRTASAMLGLLAVSACNLEPNARTESDAGSRACTSSSECAGVCDVLAGECVKTFEATCSGGKDVDCARYDGLPLCERGLCRVAECNADADCAHDSSTVACAGHRCVDNTWGCVGEADDRGDFSEPGSYELSIVGILTDAIPPDLTVTLCGSPNDFNCTTPPASALAVIDKAKGIVRVTNVPPNTLMHFQLRAPGHFDTEVYSQRSVKGKTVEPVKLALVPTQLASLFGSATDVEVDTQHNATLIARFFDCAGELASGISLATSRFHPSPDGNSTDTRTFYASETNAPDPDAAATDSFGAAGIVNLAGGKQTTLTATYGARDIATQVLIPKAGWMTHVFFYPRDYTR